jgi:hypothetical protein
VLSLSKQLYLAIIYATAFLPINNNPKCLAPGQRLVLSLSKQMIHIGQRQSASSIVSQLQACQLTRAHFRLC